MLATGIWHGSDPVCHESPVIGVAPRQDLARVDGRGLGAVLRLSHRRARLIAFALTVLGFIAWLPFILWPATFGTATDAHAYFVGDYGIPWQAADSFVYPPPFDLAIEPLRWLGWDGFRTAWRVLEVGALAVMAGPFTGLLLFVRPIAVEVNIGNVHALLGAAIVLGFRWPALWAFPLLTKITPGVGLLWFVLRREWRSLGIALGTTAALSAVSFVVASGDWFAWISVLSAPSASAAAPIVTLPLLPRLVLATLLVSWGAPRNKRWTVLAAAFIALPQVWETALAMLVGLAHPYLNRERDRVVVGSEGRARVS